MKYILTRFTALLLAMLATLHGASAADGARKYQSLDGAWQIVFDRNNEGGAKQWVREKSFPLEQMREIAVPSITMLCRIDADILKLSAAAIAKADQLQQPRPHPRQHLLPRHTGSFFLRPDISPPRTSRRAPP